jgi:lipoprotein NlpI
MPSSVTVGDSFSQREKPLVRQIPPNLRQAKAFSRWEKVAFAKQMPDEGYAFLVMERFTNYNVIGNHPKDGVAIRS